MKYPHFLFAFFLLTASQMGAQPSPEVQKLLPPPQSANGLQIEILDAGFDAPTRRFPNASNRFVAPKFCYFFTYRVSRTDGKRAQWKESDRVDWDDLIYHHSMRSKSVEAGEGLDFSTTGRTYFTSQIPWDVPFATAIFKIRPPDLPEEEGVQKGSVGWKDLTAPPLKITQKTKASPQILASGTQVTLTAIRQTEHGTSFDFEIVPAAPVHDYNCDLSLQFSAFETGASSSPATQMTARLWTKSVNVSQIAPGTRFDLRVESRESTSLWRDHSRDQFLAFRLPVAPLAKFSPRVVPPAPVWNAQSATWGEKKLSAQLEWRPDYGMGSPSARLWVQGLPTAQNQKWGWSGGELSIPGVGSFIGAYGGVHEGHSDGRAPQKGEIGLNLGFVAAPEFAALTSEQKVKVHFDLPLYLISEREIEGWNDFDFPLPQSDEALEWGPDEFVGESLALRRAIRVSTPEAIAKLGFSPDDWEHYGARLALVCDFLPLAKWPYRGAHATVYALDEVAPFEDRAVVGHWLDALSEGPPKPNRITFLVPLPAMGTQKMRVQALTAQGETLDSPQARVVFQNVTVPPTLPRN